MLNCPRCNYSSSLKSNIVRHLKTKKCVNNGGKYISKKKALEIIRGPNNKKNENDETEIIQQDKYICEVCSRTYTKNSNLYRHIRTNSECKEKYLQQDETIKNKQVIKKIINGNSNTINNTNNNTNSHNNTAISANSNNNSNNNNGNTTIIINNFGHENLDYVTSDMLKAYVKIPYAGVKQVLNKIHFDEKHPENHNIKITNKKYPYVSVYSNGAWEMKRKKPVIEEIIDKGNNIIERQFEISELEFTAAQRKRYKNYIHNYENTKRVQKDLYHDAYLLLLNKSNSLFKQSNKIQQPKITQK